jgi:hypothetical protein
MYNKPTNKYICSSIHSMKANLSLCLTNWALRHEELWRSACIDPRILDLCPCWRWVVSFMPGPLYPWGKSPRYPLDRRVGGLRNQSRWRGRRKSRPYLDSNSEPSAIESVASREIDWAISAPISEHHISQNEFFAILHISATLIFAYCT